MPSLEHNGLIELFRENPALAPLLLEQGLHLPVPAHTSVAVVEAALDQLVPIEYRADLVVEVRQGDKPVLSIVVEAQLGEDPEKKLSWPVYVTVERARKRCQACVLVIAPDAKVAAWAAQPIELGMDGGTIRPRVLGPAEVPMVTDREEARRVPEVAVLSALAHGNEPGGLEVVLAALGALEGFDETTVSVYRTIIYEALGSAARTALEEIIVESEKWGEVQEPPFVQKLLVRGEARGEARGRRAVLLKMVARAGITLSADERTRIEGCAEITTLDRWIDNAFTAKAAEELFR